MPHNLRASPPPPTCSSPHLFLTNPTHKHPHQVRGQWLSDSANGTPPPWVADALSTQATLACPLLGILRSPQLDGYRNKCEFSIGLGVDNQPTVGFLLGSFKDGYVEVAAPEGCRHIPQGTLSVASWAQEYIREHSKLPVWDKRYNAGGQNIVKTEQHSLLIENKTRQQVQLKVDVSV